jgi:hypothetical protein
MNMVSRKSLSALAVLALSLAGAGMAQAQDTPPQGGAMGSMRSGDNDMHGMKNMMGMHAMPATVSSVDKQTGLVDVNSEGMSLKVHFPAPAVANLNVGDKITLHMGYSKP